MLGNDLPQNGGITGRLPSDPDAERPLSRNVSEDADLRPSTGIPETPTPVYERRPNPTIAPMNTDNVTLPESPNNGMVYERRPVEDMNNPPYMRGTPEWVDAEITRREGMAVDPKLLPKPSLKEKLLTGLFTGIQGAYQASQQNPDMSGWGALGHIGAGMAGANLNPLLS